MLVHKDIDSNWYIITVKPQTLSLLVRRALTLYAAKTAIYKELGSESTTST